MTPRFKRDVGCQLDVDITAPTTLEFQIAVAPHPHADVFESVTFTLAADNTFCIGAVSPTTNPFHATDSTGVNPGACS